MTFVNRHDVIDLAVRSHDLEKEFLENSEKKYIHDAAAKEELMHELKKKSIIDERYDSLLKHDHCLFEKRCFTDEYEFNFSEILGDEPYEGGLLFNAFDLDPAAVYGFENIKKYSDYFRVTKLSIHFASNADSNFSPIILKYLPPTVKQELTPQICMQATKTATSMDGAYMSLINPEYMIHIKRPGEEEIVLPQLSSLLLCSDTENCKYDYGTLVFYSRNPEQEVTFTLFWEFDYISGTNYINVEEDENGCGSTRFARIARVSKRSEHISSATIELEQRKKARKPITK